MFVLDINQTITCCSSTPLLLNNIIKSVMSCFNNVFANNIVCFVFGKEIKAPILDNVCVQLDFFFI